MMLSTHPILSSERIAEDIVVFLTDAGIEVLKEILNDILKEYKPEAEYEEPTGSKLYDIYSTVSTYLISTAQTTIYSYTRTRTEEITNTINEITIENKLQKINEILSKPFANLKSTSLNTLLLNAIMRKIPDYNPNASVYGEPLKEVNGLVIYKLEGLLNEGLKEKLLEKRRNEKKKYEAVKNNLLRQIQDLELEKIKKEGAICENEINFSQISLDTTLVNELDEEQSKLNKNLCALINEYNNLVSQRNTLLTSITLEEKKYQTDVDSFTGIMPEDKRVMDELGSVGRQFESLFISKWMEEDNAANNKTLYPRFMSEFFENAVVENDEQEIKNEINKTLELKKTALEVSSERDRSKDITYRTGVYENLLKDDYQQTSSGSGMEIKSNVKYFRSQLMFAYSPDYSVVQSKLEEMTRSHDQKKNENNNSGLQL